MKSTRNILRFSREELGIFISQSIGCEYGSSIFSYQFDLYENGEIVTGDMGGYLTIFREDYSTGLQQAIIKAMNT